MNAVRLFPIGNDGPAQYSTGPVRQALDSFGMEGLPDGTTLLFTDIEGSTLLWEEVGERMSGALAKHDNLSRAAVESNRGVVVKMTGDGMYAAFDDPLDAVNATLTLQLALSDPAATNGVAFRVRYGLHL